MGRLIGWVLETADIHPPHPVRHVRAKIPAPATVTRRAVFELDDRLGMAKAGRRYLDKIFPDHWSFLIGEIALYSFVVLVATGIYLTLYFVPSATQVVYHGPYRPLDGESMSEAYASVLNISLHVRAGLLFRQMHHWAAEVFIGAIVLHLGRIFFTSAYRKPRSINWCVGVTLLLLAIVNGYLGYSLPDDLLSGTGVRIGFSIILSIPIVGTYLAFFMFGGNFPGTAYIPRFFIAHVLLVPGLIIVLLSLHLALVIHQEHTQWPGKGRTEHNVVGSSLWPQFSAKTGGLFLMVCGSLAILAGTAQIDPIWQIGPYDPPHASTAAQPDWYVGWLEGALRIMPSWESRFAGHTIPWTVFFPAVVVPVLTFAVLYLWPWLQARLTKDFSNHHLLAAPRDRPLHTAVGAGVFSFYFVLFVAGGDDVLAHFFAVSINAMVVVLRVCVFVVPVVVGLVTWRVCTDLQAVPPRRRRGQRAVVGLTEQGSYEPVLEPPPPEGHLAPEPVPTHAAMSGGTRRPA